MAWPGPAFGYHSLPPPGTWVPVGPWPSNQQHWEQQQLWGQHLGRSSLAFEEEMERLLAAAPDQLLARRAGGPTTGPGLLVHTGELVDRLQAQGGGGGRGEAGGGAGLAEELADQVCTILNPHVTGMRTQHRKAGAPDLLLRFGTSSEAQLRLGELRRAGTITVPLGARNVTVQVSGSPMHLRSRHAKVVVRHLPMDYLAWACP